MLELTYETTIDAGYGEYEIPVEIDFMVGKFEEWPTVKLLRVYNMNTDEQIKLDKALREELIKELELHVWHNPELLTDLHNGE